MQLYNKSTPYSNMMLRARMSGGGRLLDVGEAANPQRANALADIFSGNDPLAGRTHQRIL